MRERSQDMIRVAKMILFNLFASNLQYVFHSIFPIDSKDTVFRTYFPFATIYVIVLCYITFCNSSLISIALEFLPMANARWPREAGEKMKYELWLWNVHLTVCERCDNHRGDEL